VDREGWRRLLWVVSLLAVLCGSLLLLVRYGAEWGIGAAP
jgi:hypothetical protein